MFDIINMLTNVETGYLAKSHGVSDLRPPKGFLAMPCFVCHSYSMGFRISKSRGSPLFLTTIKCVINTSSLRTLFSKHILIFVLLIVVLIFL